MTRPRRNLNFLVVALLLLIAGCTAIIIIGKDNTLDNTKQGAESEMDLNQKDTTKIDTTWQK